MYTRRARARTDSVSVGCYLAWPVFRGASPSTPTAVTLVDASPADAPTLTRLMQLYVHDLSDLVPMDVDDDGRFPFAPEARYWSEERFHPYFIRADGKLAGFLVVDDVSRLTGAPVSDMSQFFILKRYRRCGVGARAARLAFDLRPGPWEVRQAPANVPAIAFWRRVIADYTGGAFTDEAWEDKAFNGQVQRFDRPRG